ncbi:hypothetical protein GCM10027418_15090 [Mariniluteicoccus endophyticus]
MAVLVDPPRWPALGTEFGHLVSDASLGELHAVAAGAGLSPRAFDHDHYDVPRERYAATVAAGAEEVGAGELASRLAASGLRVRPGARAPRRTAAVAALRARWHDLFPHAPEVGEDLIARWADAGRHYHDVRHLHAMLAALDLLGAADRRLHLAAWFHDAVYAGEPAADEEASARLAEDMLPGLVAPAEVAEVGRLVRLTATHTPDRVDERGQLLCDADLAVLGAVPGRYDVYARDVRLEHAHLDDPTFTARRRQVLTSLAGRPSLYATARARELWQEQAYANLARELSEGAPLYRLRPGTA